MTERKRDGLLGRLREKVQEAGGGDPWAPRRMPESHVVTEHEVGDDIPYGRRLRDAAEWRRLNPGYSACFRCGMPWAAVTPKRVPRDDGGGVFALCLACWRETGIEERVRAHLMLPDFWQREWQRLEPWVRFHAPTRSDYAAEGPALEAAVRRESERERDAGGPAERARATAGGD